MFTDLRWTDERIEKVSGPRGHGVTPEEVDEAFYDDDGAKLFRSKAGRYVHAGRTHAGRRVLVVLVDEGAGIAGPISAREPTMTERRRYFGD